MTPLLFLIPQVVTGAAKLPLPRSRRPTLPAAPVPPAARLLTVKAATIDSAAADKNAADGNTRKRPLGGGHGGKVVIDDEDDDDVVQGDDDGRAQVAGSKAWSIIVSLAFRSWLKTVVEKHDQSKMVGCIPVELELLATKVEEAMVSSREEPVEGSPGRVAPL